MTYKIPMKFKQEAQLLLRKPSVICLYTYNIVCNKIIWNSYEVLPIFNTKCPSLYVSTAETASNQA